MHPEHEPAHDDSERPALGVLEIGSIARGVVVADAAVKQASSLLLRSQPVSSGKYVLMMRGQVAEVEESMKVAREVAGSLLLDSLELAYVHGQLWRFINRPLDQPAVAFAWKDEPESVAVVEVATVCACIGGADKAVKTAPVILRDMRLAVGIAGKAFFTFTGALADVQAAAEAAAELAGGRTLAMEVIAAPADELRGRLFF